jgi:hypothetical protein
MHRVHLVSFRVISLCFWLAFHYGLERFFLGGNSVCQWKWFLTVTFSFCSSVMRVICMKTTD